MQSYEDVNSECMVFGAIHILTGCGWACALSPPSLRRTRD